MSQVLEIIAQEFSIDRSYSLQFTVTHALCVVREQKELAASLCVDCPGHLFPSVTVPSTGMWETCTISL